MITADSTDEEIIKFVIDLPWTNARINSKGEREVYDEKSGLWFKDTELASQMRGRMYKQRILGSGEDTQRMNRDGV